MLPGMIYDFVVLCLVFYLVRVVYWLWLILVI